MMRSLLLPVAVCSALVLLMLCFSKQGNAADDTKRARIERAISAGPLSVTASISWTVALHARTGIRVG
jgi:hypothetical protein